jgi:hypothetical protein
MPVLPSSGAGTLKYAFPAARKRFPCPIWPAFPVQQGRILLTENGLCRGVVAGMTSPRFRRPNHGPISRRHNRFPQHLCRPADQPGAAIPGISHGGSVRFCLGLGHSPIGTAAADGGEHPHRSPGRCPLETIVDQMPPAGYRVTPGQPCGPYGKPIQSGRYSGDAENADQVELFRFSLENGFLKKHVQVKMNQPQMSLSLFDDFLAPGQEIWLLVPKSGNPTILVYVDGQLVETRMMVRCAEPAGRRKISSDDG